MTDLKPPEAPPNVQTLREAEVMEVLIHRETETQHFVAMKERFKTEAIGSSSVASAPSTGLEHT